MFGVVREGVEAEKELEEPRPERGETTRWAATWRIIPDSKWLISMVGSPLSRDVSFQMA